DLDDVILAEAARLRSLGDMSVEIGIVPARVIGDGASLVRVVRNLADNARRHATGQLRLSLTVHSGPPGGGTVTGSDPVATAVLTVDDDGPGVAPDQRASVFDRFARLDYDRARNRGGSGLGLAIVAEI